MLLIGKTQMTPPRLVQYLFNTIHNEKICYF